MGDDSGAGANLPPGFRFYPTDEELVVHFLHRRAALLPCHPDVIPDLDLFPYDPWDLDGKALSEGRTWYYYSRRTQNRASESGYWKPMGVDEPIFSSANGRKVGMKKYFTFCMGDPSSDGAWTNWILHEYRLSDASSASTSTSARRSRSKSDQRRWVICKVYEQSEDGGDNNGGTELSCLDEVFLSMDDYDEISLPS